MPPTRFTKLTTRQRECLRLYHQRLRIKEIAGTLAISENTASGYLTEAAAILNAGGRRAAAAALVAFENDHPDARGRFSTGYQEPISTEPVQRSGPDAPTISSWSVDILAIEDLPASASDTDVPSSESRSTLSPPDHPYPRGRSQVGDQAPSFSQDEGRHRNSAVLPKHYQRTGRPGRAWVPLRQGDGNDLTVTQRFAWLGVVTFLLISGFGIFAFFIRTVSDLAGGLVK